MERYGTNDIIVGAVAIVTTLGLFSAFLGRKDPKYIIAAGLKLICFVAYNAFLTLGEGGDSYYYHDVGLEYADTIKAFFLVGDTTYFTDNAFWSPLGSQTGRMFSLSGLFLWFTGGSYLGASAIFCGLGFLGQIILHRAMLLGRSPNRPSRLIDLGCLYLPSFVFWSSGLLKDPLGLLGLATAFYGWRRLQDSGVRLKWLVLSGLGYYIMYLFRVQMVPCLLAASLASLLAARANKRLTVLDRSVVAIISLILIIAAQVFWSKASEESKGGTIRDLPWQIQQGSLTYSDTGYQQVGVVVREATWLGLFLGAPVGIGNALFRPFPWDVRNPLMALAAIENLLIIWVTYKIIVGWKAIWRRDDERGNIAFSVVFILILSALVGTSTINLGSSSRYRICTLPFVCYLGALAANLKIRKRPARDGRPELGVRRSNEMGPSREAAQHFRS